MKQLIKRHFPHFYQSLKRLVAKDQESMKGVFSTIHKSNAWLGTESISGLGSDSVNTRVLKLELPGLFRELGIRSMLDAPCGDLAWMREIHGGLERYVGADIVPEVIRRNKELYRRPNSEFRVLDITKSKLPRVDLILCRDCLVHFSREHIGAALQAFKDSGSTYLLTTTFTGPRPNRDIRTGEWRPLNLEAPPFSLTAPTRIINEDYRGEDGQFSDKSLGLWELRSIDVVAIGKRIKAASADA
jgi:hypothetical protein